MFLSIDTVRRATMLMRSTAALLLFSFNFVFIFSPTALAVEEELTKDAQYQAQIEQVLEATPAKKLAHRLQKLKENLTQKLPEAIQKREEEKGILDQALDFFLSDLPVISDEVSELDALKQQVTEAYQEAIQGFEDEAQLLEDKNLPAIAKERHQAALNKVKGQFNAMMAQLNVLVTTEDADEQQGALDALTEMLLQTQFKRGHTPEDPNKLPWRTPDSNVREPAQTKTDLLSHLDINPIQHNPQLASLGFNPAMLSASAAAFNLPTDADLAPTMDAPITPEIQALADQLNNNVVEIYTWVHNNIRFIPSYGSIQGAQMTLETKRGNAMDTASLAIALLRASNIPARYAYGTVEIPTEKVQNWVGGVNNANAAGNLLGQGGIPNKALIMGGQVKYFQLEHVWVEAYVDFEPSRGMQNGEKDSWIPLDPSFKQYEFSQGMDLEQQVPFDAQALVDEIQASATINEDEGWVQNVPAQAIEQKLEEYQQALTDYIETQNPDATVGEVLGLQEVKVLEPRPLAAGLPYNHIVTTQQFSEVPNNLRHRFKYELNGEATISIDEPTVKLAGKKLSLSFSPATQDDADIIESYLPKPDPQTGEINPEDLPDTLPGYLINLKAEFAIGNEVVAEANAGTMGTELYETLGYWDPRFGWDLSQNKPTAGEYQAIGLDLQGSSPEYAAKLQAELEDTKAKLESGDEALLDKITKEKIQGNLLDSIIYTYFVVNNILDEINASSSGVVEYRAPSYGKYSTSLSTNYWFGTPRDVMPSGAGMDVDRVYSISVDRDNDRENRVNYNLHTGYRYSSMEHFVPNLILSTEEAPVNGVSAVELLNAAAENGQTIWRIDRSNLDFALASINLDAEVELEINNSVRAGMIVTAHEFNLIRNNWVGSGYIIIDPTTGAGAYKISGGANGNHTSDTFNTISATLLGMVDGFLGYLKREGDVWFSERIKYGKRLLRASFAAGMIAIFGALASVVSGGDNLWDATGKMSIALFAFSVTAYIVGAIAASAAIAPVVAAVLGAMVAGSIATLTNAFSKEYF